jgi:RecA-family ATPase
MNIANETPLSNPTSCNNSQQKLKATQIAPSREANDNGDITLTELFYLPPKEVIKRIPENILDIIKAVAPANGTTINSKEQEIEVQVEDLMKFASVRKGYLDECPPPNKALMTIGDSQDLVIPQGKVGLILAEGGVGKTLLNVDLAICQAIGRRFLDLYDVSEPGNVLLALAEEDEPDIRRRLYNAACVLKLTTQERNLVMKRLVFLPLSGKQVSLLRNDKGLVHFTSFKEVLFSFIEKLNREWKLIILDPLSRFAGYETEVSACAATTFIEVLEELTQVPGNPTVICSHHTNKSSRVSKNNNAIASRGSSALTDGARFVLFLESIGLGNEHLRLLWAKSNYSVRHDPVNLIKDSSTHGAIRAMKDDELEKFNKEEKIADSKKTTTDDELDAAIKKVLQDHGKQTSIKAIETRLRADNVCARSDRMGVRIRALVGDSCSGVKHDKGEYFFDDSDVLECFR